MKWVLAGITGLVVILVIAVVVVVVSSDGDDVAQHADFGGQGGEGQPLAMGGAQLLRSPDGLRVQVIVPTPEPGSYEYPTGDMVGPGVAAHPDVAEGEPGEPEVFTMWVFVFNNPDLCTDDSCDTDDLEEDALARGGAFQADGRIADGDELDLVGSVRLGQIASKGSPLENPLGAEVHLAIAPHGAALTGSDLDRQLNGPIGNPTLWWGAPFLVSDL